MGILIVYILSMIDLHVCNKLSGFKNKRKHMYDFS